MWRSVPAQVWHQLRARTTKQVLPVQNLLLTTPGEAVGLVSLSVFLLLSSFVTLGLRKIPHELTCWNEVRASQVSRTQRLKLMCRQLLRFNENLLDLLPKSVRVLMIAPDSLILEIL